uniref:Uncharacterized protein n=1 Tax=Rhipicephalus zambeziensis TaxID=60191 RepID=A0A224YHV6_9ACAR
MKGSTFATTIAFVLFACLLSPIEEGGPSFALALPFPEPNPGAGPAKLQARLPGVGPRPPQHQKYPGKPLPPRVKDLSKAQVRRVQRELYNPQRNKPNGK